jgi:hypothetical protein
VAESKGPGATARRPNVESFLIGGLGFYALRFAHDSEVGGLKRLAPDLLVLILCCYYPTPTEAKAAARPYLP